MEVTYAAQTRGRIIATGVPALAANEEARWKRERCWLAK